MFQFEKLFQKWREQIFKHGTTFGKTLAPGDQFCWFVPGGPILLICSWGDHLYGDKFLWYTTVLLFGCSICMTYHNDSLKCTCDYISTRRKYAPCNEVCLISNNTRSKKFSPKNKKDLGMACHTPPLKKVKKQGEIFLLLVCEVFRAHEMRSQLE